MRLAVFDDVFFARGRSLIAGMCSADRHGCASIPGDAEPFPPVAGSYTSGPLNRRGMAAWERGKYMTRFQKLTRALLRLAGGAAAGAVIVVLGGQAMSLITDSCTLVCQPGVAAPFGALVGAIAFFPQSR